MDRAHEGNRVKRFLAALTLLALTACATSTVETPTGSAPPEVPPIATGPIALHADKAFPAEITAAFAREIETRLSGVRGAEEVRSMLMAQGFQCADAGDGPEVKIGDVFARCDLPKPHGLCSDKWSVDLRLRELTRALDFARVSSEGRFERFCTNGASPNG